eukprot:Ihof_evm5s324 gene=Ihof_evmTU5s324
MVSPDSPYEGPLRTAKGLLLQCYAIYSLPVVRDRYCDTLFNSHLESDVSEAPEGTKIVYEAIKKAGVTKVKFMGVPSDYYEWSLMKRCNTLLVPSMDHLCKSLVFENTHCTLDDCSDPCNSRYYCVVVQYITKLNTDTLGKYIQSLKTPRLPNKNYTMRLAKPEDSLALTGFDNNGVSPYGMKNNMPIILSQAIRNLK